MKRIILFLLTNLAILVVLGIVLNIVFAVMNVRPDGIYGLLVFAAVFGMGGSFISLALSKWIAKRATGAQVIDQPRNHVEAWLVDRIRVHAERAGIGMPEVAIYNSPAMNAFATGMRRDDSLVAVSTGLLENMNEDEVEAVLGHEITHISNGDMVTLALIQGVVNTFVIFLARVVAGIINSVLRGEHEEGGLGFFSYIIVVSICEILFGVLAGIVVMWFSRQREYRADAGGARLAGTQKMIGALRRLQSGTPSRLPDEMKAFGISGKGKSFSRLFMSHPPLEERIDRLRSMS